MGEIQLVYCHMSVELAIQCLRARLILCTFPSVLQDGPGSVSHALNQIVRDLVIQVVPLLLHAPFQFVNAPELASVSTNATRKDTQRISMGLRFGIRSGQSKNLIFWLSSHVFVSLLVCMCGVHHVLVSLETSPQAQLPSRLAGTYIEPPSITSYLHQILQF